MTLQSLADRVEGRAWWRHALRGCGTIPYVGDHPGTGYVLFLIVCGAIAGRHGGVSGIFIGAGIMAAVMGPIYLFGAYGRSKLSDQLARTRGPATPLTGRED